MDRSVYERMNLLEQDHWWFTARRSILRTAIDRLVPLGTGAAILEAGCGTGGNLGFLSELGTLDAFEYDDEARRQAEAKSNRAIFSGALPDGLPEPGRSYDLIALFDVLEHIEDDGPSLRALGDRLTRSGRIILTVPAYQWLWSRHDERHHHFRRYTKATLRQTVEGSGLVMEHAFYFNTFLFPVALALRGVKALLGRDTPDDDMPSPAINAALRRVFRSERHLVGRVGMPFGLSLCAVLRKDIA